MKYEEIRQQIKKKRKNALNVKMNSNIKSYPQLKSYKKFAYKYTVFMVGI